MVFCIVPFPYCVLIGLRVLFVLWFMWATLSVQSTKKTLTWLGWFMRFFFKCLLSSQLNYYLIKVVICPLMHFLSALLLIWVTFNFKLKTNYLAVATQLWLRAISYFMLTLLQRDASPVNFVYPFWRRWLLDEGGGGIAARCIYIMCVRLETPKGADGDEDWSGLLRYVYVRLS